MYIPAIVTPLEINSNPIAPEKLYINKPNVKKTYKKNKKHSGWISKDFGSQTKLGIRYVIYSVLFIYYF